MVRSTTSKQKPVTREILNKELSGLENRFEAKIDSAVQSMKQYTDSRWKQVDAKFDAKFDAVDHRFTRMEGLMQNSFGALGKKIDNLGMKLSISVKGLVEMTERNAGGMAGVETRLDNHELRITTLEAKA